MQNTDPNCLPFFIGVIGVICIVIIAEELKMKQK